MKGFGHRFSAFFFMSLAVVLMFFSRSNDGVVAQSRAGLSNMFVPLLDIVSQPIEVFDDFVDWTQNVALVFTENERLREENQRLLQAQIAASQLIIDNQRLKELLSVKEGELEKIATSRAVSDSGGPFFNSVLINVGLDDGVQKGQAVITEKGIIGRVISAGMSSARVLLITDLNSRVPVKIADSGLNMILEGDNTVQPTLTFRPDEYQAKVGDLVLTSGFGKVYPPDLAVGQVSEISEDGVVRIRLTANLKRLNFISVVKYKIADEPVVQEVVQ